MWLRILEILAGSQAALPAAVLFIVYRLLRLSLSASLGERVGPRTRRQYLLVAAAHIAMLLVALLVVVTLVDRPNTVVGRAEAPTPSAVI